MTQQNAALVEQSAAAADSLKDQARSLSSAVAVFPPDGLTARPPSLFVSLSSFPNGLQGGLQ